MKNFFQKSAKWIKQNKDALLLGISILSFVVLVIMGMRQFITYLQTRPIPLRVADKKTGFLFEAASPNITIRLGKRVSNTPVIEVSSGDSRISFVLEGARKNATTPVQDGNKLTFKDSRPNTDVTYTTLPNGIKEEIILRAPQQTPFFQFLMNSDGAIPKKSVTSSYYDPVFYSAKGDYLFHIPKPFAVDAKGVRTDNVILQIQKGELPNKYLATLIVDEKWMRNPKRAYPITIDPTVVYAVNHNEPAEFALGQLNRVSDVGLEEHNALATGGVITTIPGTNYIVHTFYGSGTFTPSVGMNVEVLVVGGGGGGGKTIGGGGGGGGVLTNSSLPVTTQAYAVTVGAGGAGGSAAGYVAGTKGGNSVFSSLTAIGGGAGAGYNIAASGTGGSAGGNGAGGGARAGFTAGQGNNGSNQADTNNAGAGGGAGAVGGAASASTGGTGGIGIISTISGSPVYYGAGGGGGTRNTAYTPGNGGVGGGGAGGEDGAAGANGIANTGGGGGGGGYRDTGAVEGNGGTGGSGIVIIRYLNPNASTISNIETDYQELTTDANTIGLWHMNEASGNILDASGNGNTGVITGTTVVSGKIGYGRSFNGSTDKIIVANSPSLSTTQKTIETWIKFNSYGLANRLFIGRGAEVWVTYNGTAWGCTANQIGFMIYSASAWVCTSSGFTPSLNRWYHFAGTYDGNHVRLYIDGELMSSALAATPPTLTTNSFDIGDYFGGGYSTPIDLDELRFSNIARTQEEIKASAQRRPYGIYTSEVIDLSSVESWSSLTWSELGVKTGDGETLKDATGLIAQWNFNETSGTTANNNAGSCGTNCNGTLAGVGGTIPLTGGTVTDAGGYRIHTFTSSGTLTVPPGGDKNVEVLVVAGGGGGGGGYGGTSSAGGGGGGGQAIYNASYAVSGVINVTVGSGGARGQCGGPGDGCVYSNPPGNGGNGGNSIFGSITSLGGGGGGIHIGNGANGGTGGGGGTGFGGGGSGASGYSGGQGGDCSNPCRGGGGGGAGESGASSVYPGTGNGGNGYYSTISGVGTYYGGGGGGSQHWNTGNGIGGLGGGASGLQCYINGSTGCSNGNDGAPNSGGGGSSGVGMEKGWGGAGGSGIVILRYPYTPPSSGFAYTASQDQAPGTGWTSVNKRWGAGALMFDGADDYVTVPDNNALSLTTFSLETWVKPSILDSSYDLFVGKGNEYWLSYNQLSAGCAANKFAFAVYDGDWVCADANSVNVSTGQWYHLVGTYDGANLRLYVNGVLAMGPKAQGNPSNLTYALTIGGFNGTGTNEFKGVIDSTRLYNRALTPAEILSNYNSSNVELQTRVGSYSSAQSISDTYVDSSLINGGSSTGHFVYQGKLSICLETINPNIYLDTDGDGYGTGAAVTCRDTNKTYVANNTDCDDGNVAVFRSVNGYLDGDGDTYGAGALASCVGATGTYVANNTDCNDADASVKNKVATGGTITNSGGYTIHTFTSSGTFTPTCGAPFNTEVLVVAGGGGGGKGYGGGGGGGGLLYSAALPVTAQAYPVTVGAGGGGGYQSGYSPQFAGQNGENSVFSSLTAIGGGGGCGSLGCPVTAGGSGGGGRGAATGQWAVCNPAIGLGTPGQGYNGGCGIGYTGMGGGGGGAGQVGYNGVEQVRGGNGGNGLAYSISGSSVYYGGGGGGTTHEYPPVATGGLGGGGNGYAYNVNPTQGTDGLGGGGGGWLAVDDGSGARGGSGIVIIRY